MPKRNPAYTIHDIRQHGYRRDRKLYVRYPGGSHIRHGGRQARSSFGGVPVLEEDDCLRYYCSPAAQPHKEVISGPVYTAVRHHGHVPCCSLLLLSSSPFRYPVMIDSTSFAGHKGGFALCVPLRRRLVDAHDYWADEALEQSIHGPWLVPTILYTVSGRAPRSHICVLEVVRFFVPWMIRQTCAAACLAINGATTVATSLLSALQLPVTCPRRSTHDLSTTVYGSSVGT